jgi:RNA polymerase sigma-70 factor, ECF subfamily
MTVLDPESLPGHTDRLYRAALALCGSRQEAEDLVQETFVRVLARRRVLHGLDEKAYLMKVLRNTFLTGRRTASRRPAPSGVTVEDLQPPDPRRGERPEEAAEIRELLAAIATLSEDQRLALVAVELVGLSHREAAKALGTREATIATRIFRARERLAKDLAVREAPGPGRDGARTQAGPGREPRSRAGGKPDAGAPETPTRARVSGAREGAREGTAREGPAPVRSLLQRDPT